MTHFRFLSMVRSVATVGVLCAAGLVAPATASAAVDPPTVPAGLRLTVASAYPANPNWRGTREYDRTNIDQVIEDDLSADSIGVWLSGGTGTLGVPDVSLDLQVPKGQVFSTGRSYTGDDPYRVRGHGDFAVGSNSCDGVDFTVHDAATDGARLVRLDATFVVTCGLSAPQMVGEFTVGEPQPIGTLLVSASSLGWGTGALGLDDPARLPVRYRNLGRSPVVVGSARLAGSGAADFRVTSDGCSRRRIAPGASCALDVAFRPSRAGARAAVLDLEVAGRPTAVRLGGTGSSGRTELIMDSKGDDFIGKGRRYLVTEAQYPFRLVTRDHDPSQLVMIIQNGTTADDVIDLQLGRAGGLPLTTGTFATSDDPSAGGLGLDVQANGSACRHLPGSVTIRQIAFDREHTLTRLDLAFTQRCTPESGDAPLFGRLSYHATTPSPAIPAAPFDLFPGHTVRAGHPLTNLSFGDHTQSFGISSAGRAELRYDGRVIWSTSRAAGRGAELALTTAGRLELRRSDGRAVWTVGPHVGSRREFLQLQTDGGLELYTDDARLLWHSGSRGPLS